MKIRVCYTVSAEKEIEVDDKFLPTTKAINWNDFEQVEEYERLTRELDSVIVEQYCIAPDTVYTEDGEVIYDT